MTSSHHRAKSTVVWNLLSNPHEASYAVELVVSHHQDRLRLGVIRDTACLAWGDLPIIRARLAELPDILDALRRLRNGQGRS